MRTHSIDGAGGCRAAVMRTIVGIFESRRDAEAVIATLTSARFAARCVPCVRERAEEASSTARHRPPLRRMFSALRARLQALMDADLRMAPFAWALRRGAFVVKVFVDDAPEANAARRILAYAGARDIDALTDEWRDFEL